jgi:hypothetical protein
MEDGDGGVDVGGGGGGIGGGGIGGMAAAGSGRRAAPREHSGSLYETGVLEESILREIGQYYEKHLPALHARSAAEMVRRPHAVVVVLGWMLFFLLGVGPQLAQNVMYSATPVLDPLVPEGKSLAAVIISCFVVSNIAVLLYIAVHATLRAWGAVLDQTTIAGVLLCNSAVCVLCAFLWNERISVQGQEYSVALMALSLIAGAAGNVSTLATFAFASGYLPVMTTALASGYGASSAISVGVLFALDAADSSTQVLLYFLIASPFALLSLAAFALLRFTRLHAALRLRNYDRRLQSQLLRSEHFWSLRSVGRLLWVLLPLSINMLVASFIAIALPGELSFYTSNRLMLSYLVAIFLLVPSVGAALAGLYATSWPGPINVLNAVLFVAAALPLFKSFPRIDLVLYHVLLLVAVTVLSLLSGYVTSVVFLQFRKQDTVLGPEYGARLAALLNQFGGALGIAAVDASILFDLIREKL